MNDPAGILSARTAGELIRLTAQVFADAEIYYGHGTDNPLDEAAALVFHVMGLPHSGADDLYAAAASAALADAQPALIRAAQKGVVHRNTASRKVSRLTKAVKALTA